MSHSKRVVATVTMTVEVTCDLEWPPRTLVDEVHDQAEKRAVEIVTSEAARSRRIRLVAVNQVTAVSVTR